MVREEQASEANYSGLLKERELSDFVGLPEDFGWSISSLNLLNECGNAWKFRYQLKVREESGRDLPNFAFGRAVHKTIEEVHLHGFWNVVHWAKLWDEIWKEQVREVDWEVYPGRKNTFDKLGREILANYTEREENRLAEIECLEQRFDCFLEDIRVKGVIDQIRRMPGGLLLIDFKTSKESSHPLVERTDPQLTLYAHVCKQLYGFMPRVAHYYLRTGLILEMERTEEDIQPILKMMREGQERVEKGMLTRQLGWHCNECLYRGPCLSQLVR